MRAIFMGKNKQSVVKALEILARSPIEIVAVVAPPDDEPGLDGTRLGPVARSLEIPVVSDHDLYGALEDPSRLPGVDLRNIDLVLSFLFWKKIRPVLIELPRIGCLNFHPGPLPDFRGWGAYIFGIYEGVAEWGVSAHFVDEAFDTGDLISVRRFAIDPQRETCLSLERKSQRQLVELFVEVIDQINTGAALPRTRQGPGRSYSRAETEALRRISADDTPEQVARKVRAFFYPPYGGAITEIEGRSYFLVDEEMMREIGEQFHA